MRRLRAGWWVAAALFMLAQSAAAVTATSTQEQATQDSAATDQNASAKTAKSKSANGQAAPAKYDTKLPIEISSDSLEVLQHDNKAIFTGNVIAVQGKIRLKSDVMVVHYKQQQQSGQAGQAQPAPAAAPATPAATTDVPAAATTPQAGSAAPGEMGAITLIEVHGNVFMATPEESAKGDDGDYTVAEKLLHLTGGNVILTRDKNILRGTDLVYDLETGHSVLTNKGASVGGANGGRVRGVFVPNQEDKNSPKGKAGAKPAAAATPGGAATPSAASEPVPVAAPEKPGNNASGQ